jgi:two-component system nitrate/nitrite response regulator NarL
VAISSRCHAVLVGLAAGEEVSETARRLGRSLDTVKTHRRRLYKQLGARNAAHAVAIADRMGLLRTTPAVRS